MRGGVDVLVARGCECRRRGVRWESVRACWTWWRASRRSSSAWNNSAVRPPATPPSQHSSHARCCTGHSPLVCCCCCLSACLLSRRCPSLCAVTTRHLDAIHKVFKMGDKEVSEAHKRHHCRDSRQRCIQQLPATLTTRYLCVLCCCTVTFQPTSVRLVAFPPSASPCPPQSKSRPSPPAISPFCGGLPAACGCCVVQFERSDNVE